MDDNNNYLYVIICKRKIYLYPGHVFFYLTPILVYQVAVNAK